MSNSPSLDPESFDIGMNPLNPSQNAPQRSPSEDVTGRSEDAESQSEDPLSKSLSPPESGHTSLGQRATCHSSRVSDGRYDGFTSRRRMRLLLHHLRLN